MWIMDYYYCICKTFSPQNLIWINVEAAAEHYYVRFYGIRKQGHCP